MTEARPTTAARALLYSGHMVDAPGRPVPRFPPALESRVAAAIAHELDALAPTPADLAIGSGACGADLLFAEALLARSVPLQLMLPQAPSRFIESSVAFAGEGWIERFEAVARRARLRIADDELGPLREGTDAYERTNTWMLDEALRAGRASTVLLCVWNGEGGDGPGGTRHMIDVVRAAGGEVRWIDTRRLA